MNYAIRTSYVFVLSLATSLVLLGCQQPSEPAPPVSAEESHDEHEGHDHGEGEAHEEEGQASHDHSGWWCPEHGVPEEVCTRCSASLIAAFKEKGDWCDEHDRPNSQCFVCKPELEQQFAARYEAKFGKKPPKPTEL